MNKHIKFYLLLILSLFFTGSNLYSQNSNQGIDLDTVRSGKYDNGKMWTFHDPPLDYFQSEYNFTPTKEWLDHARMSALRFANYCSASFISEDGLVMTNHHCGRENVTKVTQKGENLNEDGFFANSLSEERKVPELYVSQLREVIDVTDIIKKEMDKGKSDEEKIDLLESKSEELISKYNSELNLECELVTLYNGGEYYIYCYKNFDDVRLVCAPENQIGYFGGDYDNFTYPRYNLDFTFFRVYEDNKPLKTDHYFRWSKSGIDSGGVIFVVGNPASTSRLKTVAELEMMRDVLYPYYLKFINTQLAMMKIQLQNAGENKEEIENEYFSYMNSLKVVKYTLENLNDSYLMARKKDFEKKFITAVNSKSDLKSKYGKIWDEIKELTENQKKKGIDGYNEFQKILDAKNSVLGRALFEVYGHSIPPDATFTLRLSDGVVASYEYNGTIAPVFTTFYGVYDRYYSFNSQYPWNLPDKWKTIPEGLPLETPMNFIGTCDIVGGNSGSPIINKNAEIVGLAFDGNIESLSSDFIFTTESNRMVSVDSRGIIESLRYVYKADRLYNEIINGKIGD